MAPHASNESTGCRMETYEKVIQCSLLEIVMVVSLLGNGSVFILLARFKFMRTSANILVANLAIWDILQALTQTPLYIGYAVLQSPNIRGKNVSFLIFFLRYLFGLGTLSAMALLMTDRFMALAYGMRYTAWKSTVKVFRVVMVQTIFCIISALSLTIPLYSIDLGNASPNEYSKAYRSTSHILVGQIILTSFLIIYAVLAIMTRKAIRKRKKALQDLNICVHKGRSQEDRDAKAAATVWIVVVIFVVCFLPVITQLCAWLPFDCTIWCQFFTGFFLFIPLASNPIIYYFRTERFRRALKRLLYNYKTGKRKLERKHLIKCRSIVYE